MFILFCLCYNLIKEESVELEKHLSFRKVFGILYFVLFFVFLYHGLQPAEAVNVEVSTELSIPGINLVSDVAKIDLDDNKLKTPDTIVGSFTKEANKTLLIGHVSTVFKNLHSTKVGDLVIYDEDEYKIVSSEIRKKEDINMDEILAETEKNTLVIMTCSGKDLDNGDATHRLIITAVKV